MGGRTAAAATALSDADCRFIFWKKEGRKEGSDHIWPTVAPIRPSGLTVGDPFPIDAILGIGSLSLAGWLRVFVSKAEYKEYTLERFYI